jgi:hypothetical protein
MSMLKSARCFPGEGNSRTFAAPSGADLVPPAPAAFALSGNLPDLGAAAFAASEGWLPPGMAAFAPPPPPRPLRPGLREPDDRPTLQRSLLPILVHHCRHNNSNIPSVRENLQSTSYTRRRHAFTLCPGDRKILWPPTPGNLQHSRRRLPELVRRHPPPGAAHVSINSTTKLSDTLFFPTTVPNFLFLVTGAASYDGPSSVPTIGFFPRWSAASSPG